MLVEPDQGLTLDFIRSDVAEAFAPSWGLDRISHREPKNSTEHTMSLTLARQAVDNSWRNSSQPHRI